MLDVTREQAERAARVGAELQGPVVGDRGRGADHLLPRSPTRTRAPIVADRAR